MRTDDLIAEATSLPVEDRARLADCILKSLNPPESDIDRQWAAAADRRLTELRTGQTRPVPGDEVFARIWKRYGL